MKNIKMYDSEESCRNDIVGLVREKFTEVHGILNAYCPSSKKLYECEDLLNQAEGKLIDSILDM